MASEPRPGDALHLLTVAPADEYALLELAPHWDGLEGVQAQLATALRLFVITRDPLGWLMDRGFAWATANADGETLELPVYITADEVRRRGEASAGDLEAPLGGLAEMALITATQCQGSILSGAYADLAVRGSVPRLLDRAAISGSAEAPKIELLSEAWEPVGLGVRAGPRPRRVRSG